MPPSLFWLATGHLLFVIPFLALLLLQPKFRSSFFVKLTILALVLYLYGRILLTTKYRSWWFWIHVCIFIPILAAIHVLPENTFLPKLLTALIFAALGYHLLLLFRSYDFFFSIMFG